MRLRRAAGVLGRFVRFVSELEQAGEDPWKMGADQKPLCKWSI